MKRLYKVIAILALLLSGCGRIYHDLDVLEGRLDRLEDERIPSIDDQIDSIIKSLTNLEKTGKTLDGYIEDLEATAADLQKQLDDVNSKVGGLDEDAINTTITNQVQREIENRLKAINSYIDALQSKDSELDQKITDLRSYVDTELKDTEDWAEATFATLEQYNSVVSEVATIKEQIAMVNETISSLESRLNASIQEIESSISELDDELQEAVRDITKGYTEAIQTAREEITAAYTTSLESAISELETSLKSWVGEQLSNYYTIAQIDAKIEVLEQQIASGDESLRGELSELKESLSGLESELKAAYEKAIEEAIKTNGGVIDGKIADAVTEINNRIDSEVSALNSKITALQSQVNTNTANIAKLLSRIQSISYIPIYEDDKATVYFTPGFVSYAALDFEIKPNDVVDDIAAVYSEICTVKAIYKQTRAVEFIDMPIKECVADTENGVLSLVVSAENLSEEFFSGKQSASLRLSISNDSSNMASEYVPVVAKKESLPNNEIWYTSSDGNIVTPSAKADFGAKIVSNTYENGKGVITFDGPVTKISRTTNIINDSAFYGCKTLTSITIPNSVIEIGDCAFYKCTSLKAFYGKLASEDNRCLIVNGVFNSFAIGCGATSYTIPEGVTSIESQAFTNCTSLISVTIPDSVTTIRSYAFYCCTSLTSVTIGNGVTEIGADAFYNCTSLTSVTIPDSVTMIGVSAFYNCTSLKEVYCKPTTPPTGYWDMFDNNASGRKIYVPASDDDSIINAYKSAQYWSDYKSDIYEYNFIPDNEIWYTSSDGKTITPQAKADFGANIVSNTYENGKGVITFDGPVTKISRTTNIVNDSAFYRCKTLTSITIPNSVIEIGDCAFSDCTSLKAFYGKLASEDNRCLIVNGVFNSFAIGCGATSYTIPDSVTSIGDQAFRNCTSLTSVTIPDSVTRIESHAFSYCTSLTSVTIPDSVTSIGDYAFLNCTSLTSVNIPDSVTSIGGRAFYNCTSLKEVYCKPTTPPTGGTYMFSYYSSGSYKPLGCKIYVPASDDDSIIKAYKAKQYWSSYASYIEEYDFSAGQ